MTPDPFSYSMGNPATGQGVTNNTTARPGGHRPTTPGSRPSGNSPSTKFSLKQGAAAKVALTGYNLYLKQAGAVRRKGLAVALCMYLQQEDAKGNLGRGRKSLNVALSTPARVVGVYHVNILKHKGTWYANATHVEQHKVRVKYLGFIPLWTHQTVTKTFDDLRHDNNNKKCPLNCHR